VATKPTVDVEPPATDESRPSGAVRRGAYSSFGQRYALVGALILTIVVFSLLEPTRFFTLENFQTTLSIQAIPLLLALGILPALAAGEYDLSVGSVMGLSLVLVGYLNVQHGWPIGLTVAVAVSAGIVVGLVNAGLIIGLGIESIVATLGMSTLLVGATLGISSLPVSGVSSQLVSVATTQILGIQLVFFYGVAVTIILWYVFQHTPLGRYLYFVGAGRAVARLSGIRVNAIRTGALILGSTISALAGVLQAGLLGGADPTIGPTFLLPAFAAAFLGATAVVPGRFNAWGTFFAVYFLATGIVGLQIVGLSGWIEQLFYGAALIVAVVVSRLVGMWRARRPAGAPGEAQIR
jgi:ribose transport system permease protein